MVYCVAFERHCNWLMNDLFRIMSADELQLIVKSIDSQFNRPIFLCVLGVIRGKGQ